MAANEAEVDDVDQVEPEDGLGDEVELEDVEDDLEEDADGDELEPGFEDEDLADADGDDDEAALLPAFDPDAEEDIARLVESDDDPDGEGDTVREGEFVCRSCFMAMRMSALADAKAMLCRDCA